MKSIYLSITFLAVFISTYAQNNTDADERKCYDKVEKLSSKWKLYDALEKCDECLEKFPESAKLYYARGMQNFELNHVEAAAEDFRKALDLGIVQPGFEDEEILRWICDTTFMIKELTDSLQALKLRPELGYKEPYTLEDTLQGMLRPERTCFDITYHNLTVKIIPESRSIEGSNMIYFKMLEPSKVIQLDLFSHYDISEISLEGDILNFTRLHNAVFIEFDEELEVNKSYVVKVKYNGIPREAPDPPWDGGFIWKKNGDLYEVGVTCEHLGASSWWPTKDHLSEKPDSMDINIIAPTGYDVVANGNFRSKLDLPEGYTMHNWHVSYPINSYNITFYMGSYVNFSEAYVNSSGQNVDIDYYVTEEHLDSAKSYYAKTSSIIKTFEKLFGDYPYPEDGIAFIEAPYAGMEHQGAIAIGDVYENDSSYQVYEGYPFLVVHEAAHEWWGNSVAVGDMADIWISEGFATYSEHLLVESVFGEEKYINDVGDNMMLIANIWPMVTRRDVNVNSFMGGDVYNKGAAMLHNLRCIINNDDVFFIMIREFYDRSKSEILCSQDFVDHAQRFCKKNLDDFFDVFLYQKSPPILEYSLTKHSRGRLSLTYKWTNVGEGFEMPFLLIWDDYGGYRVEGTTSEQELYLGKLKNFYLANPITMHSWVNHQNAFTYYIARMVP